ncbi:MAG TPA: DUF86 domain-containing protein [Gemmatimonadales bacterium]|nr:DUF86 domain-containing protein [Gemmatimonadales bacterium]
MPRDDTVYLAHMLETARRAGAKVSGLDQARFMADENLHLACVHLVQTIGEAASRVSAETRARCPAVPWRQVISMRHRVVHDYLEVDLEIVWKVVSADLPSLIAALEAVVPRPDSP